MSRKFIKSEKGQSLIFVALLLFVFMALLALVLDGGMAYFHRRNAQNAADAGALAGARVYCETKSVAAGIQAATDYVHENDAELVEPPTIAGNTVTVKTQITFNTTFGNLLGRPDITAVALARAGCYSPTLGRGVLPTVWACRPPVEGWPNDSTSCQQERITWEQLQIYLNNPSSSPNCRNYGSGWVCQEMYIVMDSLSYDEDFNCIEDDPVNGYLICDLDGDGESDWVASGGRSWVDLDGRSSEDNCYPTSTEGASELSNWITNGYPCDLRTHTWVPEQTGLSSSIFQNVEDRRQTNPLVVLPVFDDFCDDGLPNIACPSKWHSDVDNTHEHQPTYFHIEGFSAFYITCVRDKSNKVCPGIQRAMDLNTQLNNGQKQSIRSIEGYFLTGYVPGLEGRDDYDFDTGVFTIYLDQ